MSTKYFNFNNEADQTPITVNDETGAVTFATETFESIQEFAEFYALARDVRADNLKNWTLVEDGNRVSFVLRAATAGNDVADLVAAFRAAGMSPEEIGRAVVAAQTQAPVAPTAAPSFEAPSRHISQEVLAEMIEDDAKIEGLLKVAFGVSTYAEIEAHVRNLDIELTAYDAETFSFVLLSKRDEDYYVDEDEAYENAILEKVSEAKVLISNKYPNVPMSAAIAIELNDFEGFAGADAVRKRFAVSRLARRERLEVVTVNRNGFTPVVTTELLTEYEAIQTPNVFEVEGTIVRVIG